MSDKRARRSLARRRRSVGRKTRPRSATPEKMPVPSLADEFMGAALGDVRREQRLRKIAQAFEASPDRSLTQIARDEAESEAIYRFTNNPHFGFDDVLAPHVVATAKRAESFETVLAIHDITECVFPLDETLRDGFAPIRGGQGFRLAVSLGLAWDTSKRPIGVLSAETWTESARKNKKTGKKGKKHSDVVWGRTDGSRWYEFTQRAHDALTHRNVGVIHVADRESDAYDVWGALVQHGRRFVIRLLRQRAVELVTGPGKRVQIMEAAASTDSVAEIEVPVSRRKAVVPNCEKPRAARTARVAIRATVITVERPRRLDGSEIPETTTFNLVSVLEIDPPEGEEPVDWLLGTSEPIDTKARIREVVDLYQARWTIEDFFKALKTGAALEKRQAESLRSLEKILAVSLVAAWRLLLLRQQSRSRPTAPGTEALSALHLKVLRATSHVSIPTNATTHDVALAVARLGGHLKRNGEPGWLVLARGLQRLETLVTGALPFMKPGRCEG